MDLKALQDLKPEQLVQLLANNPQYQHLLQQAQQKIAQQQQQQQQSSNHNEGSSSSNNAVLPQYSVPAATPGGSKYNHLLLIIDEINKDIRPTFTGNRNCAERLKRGIGHARMLVRECMLEMDKQSKASSS